MSPASWRLGIVIMVGGRIVPITPDGRIALSPNELVVFLFVLFLLIGVIIFVGWTLNGRRRR